MPLAPSTRRADREILEDPGPGDENRLAPSPMDDLVQRFLAYVGELPAEERQLVLYCGLGGYTSPQAAERLGILPNTALKRWQALRSRLRESGTLGALELDEVC